MIFAVNAETAMEVILGLGANLGNPREQLRTALDELGPLLTDRAVSDVYLTSPVGFPGQPDFYNLVLCGHSVLSPDQWLHEIGRIEKSAGRIRGVRNGPRSLDIDVLALGESAIDLPGLVVPHPRMHLRRFVLEPLEQISPNWLHPLLRMNAREMLQQLSSSDRVIRLGEL
jgi:2-amino-4-hydroxy-6-hydroxymethyldihydropteridine diphosphokinase